MRLFAFWSGARRLEDARQVIARVKANPRPPESFGDGMLMSGGVKMFIDGSGGARTAWMHQDWNKEYTSDDTGNVGYPSAAPEISRQIPSSPSRRRRPRQHPRHGRSRDRLGRRQYAAALAAKPTKGLRHGIIHDNTPTDRALT